MSKDTEYTIPSFYDSRRGGFDLYCINQEWDKTQSHLLSLMFDYIPIILGEIEDDFDKFSNKYEDYRIIGSKKDSQDVKFKIHLTENYTLCLCCKNSSLQYFKIECNSETADDKEVFRGERHELSYYTEIQIPPKKPICKISIKPN